MTPLILDKQDLKAFNHNVNSEKRDEKWLQALFRKSGIVFSPLRNIVRRAPERSVIPMSSLYSYSVSNSLELQFGAHQIG